MANSKKPAFFASRRQMLKAAAGCGAMTNTSLLATFMNLQATKAAVAANNPTDYKAMVCLFLFGGIDSYNVLAPYDGTGSGDATDPNNPNITGEYGDYYRVRGGYDDGTPQSLNPGGLALEKSTLTQLADPSGRSFGLHPGMSEDADPALAGNPADQRGFADLYRTGKAAFVSNVGSLLEQTTKTTYQARTGLPLGLFSHADLQRHWMTGVPQTRSQLTGWGGRMAECLLATNQETSISMNISIGGVNLFQAGDNVTPYAIDTGGARLVSGYTADESGGFQNQIFSRAVNNVLDQTYNDLLAKSFAETHRNSTDAAIEFNAALSGININTTFANEGLSNRFKTLAKVIGAAGQAGTLNQKRQVFFISEGGWDNHSGLITQQETRLPRVSRALKSFYTALEELGLQDQVVTFTASDFARTLGTNGQGSDHAWGGNQIVMGGKVDGGKVFGEYPSTLAAGNDLDLGRGRLIPTTSVDEMAADLALWFGLSNSDLDLVLPNIRTFYGASESTPPLGLTTA